MQIELNKTNMTINDETMKFTKKQTEFIAKAFAHSNAVIETYAEITNNMLSFIEGATGEKKSLEEFITKQEEV